MTFVSRRSYMDGESRLGSGAARLETTYTPTPALAGPRRCRGLGLVAPFSASSSAPVTPRHSLAFWLVKECTRIDRSVTIGPTLRHRQTADRRKLSARPGNQFLLAVVLMEAPLQGLHQGAVTE
jgi:hypothetical protein